MTAVDGRRMVATLAVSNQFGLHFKINVAWRKPWSGVRFATQ